jgi:hypothetical protein
VVTVILAVLIVGGYIAFQKKMGIGAWGPDNTVVGALVERTYVDFSGSGEKKESHYMVVTDKGIFEVNNGFGLGVWNADELYGRLKVGQTYDLSTKGNKVTTWFSQEYPYIVDVRRVLPAPTPPPNAVER